MLPGLGESGPSLAADPWYIRPVKLISTQTFILKWFIRFVIPRLKGISLTFKLQQIFVRS